MNTKVKLAFKLKEQGAFWSYPKEAMKNIPDEVLIEETLRMGDITEIQELFHIFSYQTILQIWCEKLIPDTRIYPHNYYLARIFFNIKHPEDYIPPLQKKYSRYEKIRKADS